MDQKEIDEGCKAAIAKSSFRLRLDIFIECEGIRPVEIPDDADVRIAAAIVPRLPPIICAAEIQYPGSWRLIMRAVQVDTAARTEA